VWRDVVPKSLQTRLDNDEYFASGPGKTCFTRLLKRPCSHNPEGGSVRESRHVAKILPHIRHRPPSLHGVRAVPGSEAPALTQATAGARHVRVDIVVEDSLSVKPAVSTETEYTPWGLERSGR